MLPLRQEAAAFLARKMSEELMNMPIDEALPITRGFGHYLNLTQIAETHHRCPFAGFKPIALPCMLHAFNLHATNTC